VAASISATPIPTIPTQFGLVSQAQLGFFQSQAYQGPSQQGFAGYGQPHIQADYQQPPYTGFVQQPYQGYQMQMPYASMQRPISKEIPSYPGYAQPDLNQKLPFVTTLELPDLNMLTNDPILYAPWWLVTPHKLPSDIPKFNRNPGEYLSNHVMTFHLWCSYNSLNDDLVRLVFSKEHLLVQLLNGTLNYQELLLITSPL